MRSMHKRKVLSHIALGAAVPFALSGCVTTAEREQAVTPQLAHAYVDDKPDELQRHFYVMLTQGERNKTLNDMRIGLASIELGKYELAEQLFDDALLRIESIYANNEKAAQARQLFVKELVKDFKGEPYERTMAYYYRGLLYLRDGDFDNARASFKGGMLQDAFAEEDQNRADFALMPYLEGWASKCVGNTSNAQDDFKEFRELNSAAPIPSDTDNLLVLAEVGTSPVKISATDPNSAKPRYLKFTHYESSTHVRVTAGLDQRQGSAVATDAGQIEDIYRQASTRGGRAFDSILAGKAQFQAGANVVAGTALVGAGVAATYAAQRNDRDAAVAAGVLLLTAVIAKAAAEATEPNADTRYWDNLPDKVLGATLQVSPGVTDVKVDFMHDDDVFLSKTVPIWRAGNCAIAWSSEKSVVPGNPRAPNSAPVDQMYQAVVIPDLPSTPVVASAPAASDTKSGGGILVTPAAAAEMPATMETSSGEMKDPPSTSDTADKMFQSVKSGFMSLIHKGMAESGSNAPPLKTPE